MTWRTTLLLLLAGLLLAAPAWAQTDSDGDGVDDSVDLCPNEDASFLDTDGDGCIDANLSARHIEFWDAADLPLTYVIHEQGAPVIDDGSDFAAIQAGFDTWTTLPNVQLSAQYDGTTTQFAADGMDGINLVTFEDPEFLTMYSSAVLAVGITTSFTAPGDFLGQPVRAGQIVDADMIFNPNREFSTDSQGTGRDLQSVAFHEAGHLFGISHSAIPVATMFPVLADGIEARTPETDDEIVLFKAYPAAGSLANASVLSGTIVNGLDNQPVGGAAVFAIDAATATKVGSEYSLADGTYSFYGLPPGDYYVYAHPLDGGGGVDGVVPEVVNEYVQTIALRLFVPDYYDLNESATEDPEVRSPVTLVDGAVVGGIDIVTNVDAVAPEVVDIQPADLVARIRTDALVLLEFSEPIDFDALTQGDFRLRNLATGSDVGGTLTALNNQTILVFTPASLAYSTQYEVRLSTGFQDLFGNPLAAEFSSTFATEDPPALALGSIAPSSGVAGAVVVLNGHGFGPTAADNVVRFDGVAANVTAVSPTRLVAQVPAGLDAHDYQVTVSTGAETSNTVLYTVLDVEPVVVGNEVAVATVGGIPRAVLSLPDGAFTYAATTSGVSSILSLTGTAGFFTAVEDVALGGGTVGLATIPSGRRLYAVSREERVVYVLSSDYGDAQNPDPLFNKVLDTLPTGDEPLGITIDVPGRFAYVPTAAGRVQIWDVQLQSLGGVDETNPTYHRQIGEIDLGADGVRSTLALDLTGSRLFVLTDTGILRVFDTAAPYARLADVVVGGDPRDVVVDEAGGAVYVTDAEHKIAVVSLTSFNVLERVVLAGSPRGAVLPPQGNVLYFADRQRDELGVLDLSTTSPQFLQQATGFAAGQDPFDVVASADGQFAMVASEGDQTVRALGLGVGPIIRAIMPPAVRPDQPITIVGGPFQPVDFFEPSPGFSCEVMFGDQAVTVTRSGVNSLEVRVPDDFEGGSVRVRNIRPPVPGQPVDPVSNPFNLPLLASLTGTHDEARVASDFPASQGYDWGIGIHQITAVSPKGDIVLFDELDGDIHYMDANPLSSTYLRDLAIGSEPLTKALAFSPDGKRLYVGNPGSGSVRVLDTDRFSPTFTQRIAVIDLTILPASGPVLEVHVLPGAEYLMAVTTAGIVWVDIVESSAQFYQPVASLPLAAWGAAVHPSGRAAYTIQATGQGGLLGVVDLFGDINSSQFTLASTDSVPQSPRCIAMAPDGETLYVIGKDIVGGLNHVLYSWNVSDPFFPIEQQPIPLELNSGNSINDIDSRMLVSPNSERLFIDIIPVGGIYMDVAVPTPTEINRFNVNGVDDVLGMAISPDGTRAFTASRGDTHPYLIDFSSVEYTTVDPLTPEQLTGVAGETLPTPITLRVIDVEGHPAAGVHVEFRALGGGHIAGDGEFQIFLTDSSGAATAYWTLGPTPDPDPSTHLNTFELSIGGKLEATLVATALASPEALPLSLVTVLPGDGSANVSSTTAVQAIFSRAVDRSSITGTTFFLRDTTGNAVAAGVGYADGDRRVSLSPVTPLAYDGIYDLVIDGAITDTAGGPLTNPDVTSFTVQSAPPVSLKAVSPPAATVGVEVVLSGQGIDPDPANVRVDFAGVPAIPSATTVNSVRVRVPPGAVPGPVSVNSAGQVSNAVTFTVLIPVDQPLDEILAAVETSSTLRTTAVTPDGARSYSVSPEDDQVLPVDLVTLSALTPIQVGNDPVAIVMHPDGDRAYVANYLSSTVSVISIPDDVVIDTIAVGQGPLDLVIDPSGEHVYVVNSLEESFSVIDANASNATFNTVVAGASTGSKSKTITISPDGQTLYLGTDDGFLVFSVDPNAYGVVANASTGKSTKSITITPDGTILILLTGDGSVLVVDVSPSGGNQVVANASTGKTTKAIAITPDGNVLYLINDDDTIFAVSLELPGNPSKTVTLTVLDVIEGLAAPVSMDFDPRGTGLAVVTNGNGRLDFINVSDHPLVIGVVPADVTVHNVVFPLTNNGSWVFADVELPAGYDVADIDLSTVRLNGVVPADANLWSIQDRDGNGIDELTVAFDRAATQPVVPIGDAVEVTVTGVVDGANFRGTDHIVNQRPDLTSPVGGEAYLPGEVVVITWNPPPGVVGDEIDILFSPDDGKTWLPVVSKIPDLGFYIWTVPQLETDFARIMVLAGLDGAVIGVVVSPEAFRITKDAVGIAYQNVETAVVNGTGEVRWEVAGGTSVDHFEVHRATDRDGAFEAIADDVRSANGRFFVFHDEQIQANRTYYYVLKAVNDGRVVSEQGPLALTYVTHDSLEQNYPNAFNPKTNIRFSIAQRGPVRLSVYNVAGRRVKVLMDDVLEAGNYRVEWNGRDDRGSDVASGVYLYRLETEGFVATRKMTLVR